jgi:AcrR family transcriptional regulator
MYFNKEDRMAIVKEGRSASYQVGSGKRDRTRAKLIEAAAAVIGDKGFDSASLEEIAARAGMSRGAVYGNFKDKEELFVALIGSRWKPIAPPFPPGASLKTYMSILGRAVAAEARVRLPQAATAAAFHLYILTHPAMRAMVAERNAAVYAAMARGVAKAVPRQELPMPAKRFVRVMDALITGLLFTYFQTPNLLTEADFVAARLKRADGRVNSSFRA